MKIFILKFLFLILPSILILAPEVLGLPTNLNVNANPNPALEARNALEKRDPFNCLGSGECNHVEQEACRRAAAMFNDNTMYYKETRFASSNTNTGWGKCLAMWTCSNKADYAAGMSGWNIKWGLERIYMVGGCKNCGSYYFYASCRVTFNYCITKCA
ncbi:hypothetical protein TWF481_003600 [Arthrobotrys musiformis]|uniref:SCP domain-containing protein n=1 Tax=Arthrobotrys musiformis TaxID=47236 RepID=A0AAV9WJ07_9PEZI